MNKSDVAAQNGPQTSSGWRDVWVEALTNPSIQGMQDVLWDANTRLTRTVRWVFLGTWASAIIQLLIGMVQESLSVQRRPSFTELLLRFIFSQRILSFALDLVLGGVVAAVLFLIAVEITQLVVKALGGTGRFSKLAFAIAAYAIPLTLIASVLIFVPDYWIVLLLISVYGFILNVLAVKTVHSVDWSKAIIASVVTYVLFTLLMLLVLAVQPTLAAFAVPA